MKTVDLSKYNNAWYKPGNKFKILLWYISSRVFINTSVPYPMFIKRKLLQLFGAKIGKNVVLKQNILIKYPWFLEIGENAWIGENVWIDNLTDVKIGSNCILSQGAMLLTGNHDYKKTTFDLITGKIILESGAWIGAKAIVCPNVVVGSHAVLSVGSVASHNLLPYKIYKGNPAEEIKERKIE